MFATSLVRCSALLLTVSAALAAGDTSPIKKGEMAGYLMIPTERIP